VITPKPNPTTVVDGTAYETVTGWDDRGFLTTVTRPAGWATMVKSYDDQGFLVVPTAGAVAPPLVTGASAMKAVQTVTEGAACNSKGMSGTVAAFAAGAMGVLVIFVL
jgi:YD repeat-containing protein